MQRRGKIEGVKLCVDGVRKPVDRKGLPHAMPFALDAAKVIVGRSGTYVFTYLPKVVYVRIWYHLYV